MPQRYVGEHAVGIVTGWLVSRLKRTQHRLEDTAAAMPKLLGAVELPCGSHTATAAGVDNGDLIVYSNISSSVGCGVGLTTAQQNVLGDFMDVIAVPLTDPGAASLIHREPLAGPTDPAVRTGCHDVGVILGDVNKAACASADTINVWDVSNVRDPVLEFTVTEPGVGDSSTNGRWHSAAFTPDGEVVTVQPHGALETEVWPGYLVLRGGSYLEPSRFRDIPLRVHGTGGLDIRIPTEWSVFGLLDDDTTFRVGGAVDFSKRYFGWGVGAGIWR